MSTEAESKPLDTSDENLKSTLALADAAFRAYKWEDAAESYTVALEIMAEKYGDFSLESADVLLKYGKTLLESGIAQNTVMQAKAEEANNGEGGKEQEDEEDDIAAKALEAVATSAASLSNHFVFEDEGEEDQDGEEDASTPPSTVAAATSGGAGGGGEGNPEDDQLEDDFNAAWEVLDAARTLFGKIEGPKARLQEAECLVALGDLSLETENFPQAILDFTSALALKLTLLPTSSRQISEAHLKLGVALEFDPADPTASRPKALEECEKAKRSLMERREELVEGRSKGVVSGRENGDVKGKGKGKEVVEEEKESLVKDRVEEMSGEERKGEITSIDEILTDLDVKIEDLRTAPLPSNTLPDLLPSNVRPIPASSSTAASSSSAPVNDLSSMVKKKKDKPAPAAAAAGKRKADDGENEGQGKKSKTSSA